MEKHDLLEWQVLNRKINEKEGKSTEITYRISNYVRAENDYFNLTGKKLSTDKRKKELINSMQEELNKLSKELNGLYKYRNKIEKTSLEKLKTIFGGKK